MVPLSKLIKVHLKKIKHCSLNSFTLRALRQNVKKKMRKLNPDGREEVTLDLPSEPDVFLNEVFIYHLLSFGYLSRNK